MHKFQSSGKHLFCCFHFVWSWELNCIVRQKPPNPRRIRKLIFFLSRTTLFSWTRFWLLLSLLLLSSNGCNGNGTRWWRCPLVCRWLLCSTMRTVHKCKSNRSNLSNSFRQTTQTAVLLTKFSHSLYPMDVQPSQKPSRFPGVRSSCGFPTTGWSWLSHLSYDHPIQYDFPRWKPHLETEITPNFTRGVKGCYNKLGL